MTAKLDVEVRVQWAPAYELLVSLGAFMTRRLKPHLELGDDQWRDVQSRLPANLRPLFGTTRSTHKKDDCLLQELVDVCPGERDVETYLGWLGTLSAGAAYDALHDWAGTVGPPLPRDFAAWRDRMVQRLRAWNELYFGQVEPAILDGLRSCAETLHARLGEPAQRLVEDATNGLWIEPSPNLRCVVLVPQYHQRPYNDHTNLDHAIEILYPADVLPQPPDAVPLALLRLTRGLSDESRLRILRFLRTGPCTLTEVARFAGLSQPTVHHHLAQLRIAGLVRVHIYLSGPARYSLRPGAADALARQVDSYLEPEKGAS